jgi:hypothetical protein
MQRYALVIGLSKEEPVVHRAAARRPSVAAGGESQLYPYTAGIIHTSVVKRRTLRRASAAGIEAVEKGGKYCST